MKYPVAIFIFLLFGLIACKKEKENSRKDNAQKININLSGSLQNPAFSPDGKTIVFTRFRNGYNEPPSDLYTYNLETKTLKPLVVNNYSNVNIPGSCWNGLSNAITFSSERTTGDQIFLINPSGQTGSETQITFRQDSVAYEPTFSPNGNWIVFENHKLDEEGNGIITKYKTDGTSNYIHLTATGNNCKQPNWSPAGNKILYQRQQNGQWDIWTMNPDGSNKLNITNFQGNKTDAVFTYDGQYIIFSLEDANHEGANIYKMPATGGNPVRLTEFTGYDGAPSIAPDGDILIFESADDDPDDSPGTSLWLLKLE